MLIINSRDEIRQRRLSLATKRHDEISGRLLPWSPEAQRRIKRPDATLKTISQEDTGLEEQELTAVVRQR